MSPWLAIFVACVLAFTLTALVSDVRSKRLPNWLTVTALALALVFHIAVGAMEGGLAGIGKHLVIALLGFLVGFGVLFVPWVFGWGGGGDVKFMGALGAWLGWQSIVIVFIIAAMIGGVMLLGTLAWYLGKDGFSRTQRKLFPKERGFSGEERAKRRLSPFAVPASLATWLVLALALSGATKTSRLWQPATGTAANSEQGETNNIQAESIRKG